MTRIIALSDTHLERPNHSSRIGRLLSGADMILHAGDFVSLDVYRALSEMGRLEAVCGNADSPELKRLLPERKDP